MPKILNVSALTLLTCIVALAFTGCSKKERNTLDTSFLKLGKPGETLKSSEIQKPSDILVLNDNQSVEFIGDEGDVILSGVTESEVIYARTIIGNAKNPVHLTVAKPLRIIDLGNSRYQTRTIQGELAELSHKQKATFSFSTTPELTAIETIKPTAEQKFEINKLPDGTIQFKNLNLFSIDGDPAATAKLISDLLKGEDSSKLKMKTASPGKYSAFIHEARIQLVPTFSSSQAFENGKPTRINTRMDALLKYSIDIEYKYSIEGDLKLELPLLPTHKIPFTIPGAVPIYAQVELSLPIGVRLKAAKGGSTRVTYTAEYAFYSNIEYTQAGGLKSTGDSDYLVRDREIKTSNNVDVEAEIFIMPKFTTRIYRVLGPYAALHPYIKSQVRMPLQSGDDELFMGVTGNVGLQVSEPLFLRTLFNLNSNNLFNIFQSWDLLNPAPYQKADEFTLKAKLKDSSFDIGSLTREGFIVIHLDAEELDGNVHFKITKKPKYGVLVLSDDFTSSGDLYYYPLAKNEKEKVDEINYRILQNGQPGGVKSIKLNVSPDIIEANQRPRFSRTSPSVNATYTEPSVNANKVEQFTVDGEWPPEKVASKKGKKTATYDSFAPSPFSLRALQSFANNYGIVTFSNKKLPAVRLYDDVYFYGLILNEDYHLKNRANNYGLTTYTYVSLGGKSPAQPSKNDLLYKDEGYALYRDMIRDYEGEMFPPSYNNPAAYGYRQNESLANYTQQAYTDYYTSTGLPRSAVDGIVIAYNKTNYFVLNSKVLPQSNEYYFEISVCDYADEKALVANGKKSPNYKLKCKVIANVFPNVAEEPSVDIKRISD